MRSLPISEAGLLASAHLNPTTWVLYGLQGHTAPLGFWGRPHSGLRSPCADTPAPSPFSYLFPYTGKNETEERNQKPLSIIPSTSKIKLIPVFLTSKGLTTMPNSQGYNENRGSCVYKASLLCIWFQWSNYNIRRAEILIEMLTLTINEAHKPLGSITGTTVRKIYKPFQTNNKTQQLLHVFVEKYLF